MRRGIFIVLISAVVLTAAAFSERVAIDTAAVEAYHLRVKQAVEALPVEQGGWTGSEVPIPPSATRLLRPNAIVAREYRTPERGGIAATLLVVQCADIRDMQGHYPPNCYPAHGWTSGERSLDARLGDLASLRYEFTQITGNKQRGITVYNLFVLPTGEVTHSMDRVRKAGANYAVRPYGAAQIQIVINDAVSRDQHAWILDEMSKIVGPVLGVLLEGAGINRKGVLP